VAHGLGIAPKAIIFWTSGKTTASGATGSGSYLLSFGFTDGTTNGSIGTTSLDATSTPTDKHYVSPHAVEILTTAGAAAGEADMQATPWDATNFYLTWTANDANAYIVHFLAIGGSGVQAKVKTWPNPGATGPVSITGIGFAPNLVFNIHAYGSIGCGCPTFPILHGGFGLGVMDAGGEQWATTFWNADGGAKTNTQRGQQTNAALYAIHDVLTVQQRATIQSMDPDGFTVNFSTSYFSSDSFYSLALSGVNMAIGSFAKTTSAAPVSQPISGLRFQPAAVLLASFGDITQANPVTVTHMGIGASDGTTEGSVAVWEPDNLKPSVVDGAEKTTKVFMKGASGCGASATCAIAAEADLTSLDANGFTLNWTTNDAVATEMLYVALGPLGATAVTLTSFTATPMADGRTRLVWHTGYEVDTVGFRLYREQNGVRVKITSSIVPGTALIGMGRGASNGDREYSFSDNAPSTDAGPVQYWLEDVDLKGRSTWHGPIAPAIAPDRAPR
jgi:hypothetical protein